MSEKLRQTALDAIDRKILALLQEDARLANVELADKVGLSPSPCLRRVRDLEAAGIIRRYVTLLNPAAIGLPVSVFVNVTLERQVEQALERFEAVILKRPEVMECYLMTGDADYLPAPPVQARVPGPLRSTTGVQFTCTVKVAAAEVRAVPATSASWTVIKPFLSPAKALVLASASGFLSVSALVLELMLVLVLVSVSVSALVLVLVLA